MYTLQIFLSVFTRTSIYVHAITLIGYNITYEAVSFYIYIYIYVHVHRGAVCINKLTSALFNKQK